MSQLVKPSAALNQAFVLPKVDDRALLPTAQPQASVLMTYGIVVSNFGLLLPTGVASRLVEADIRLCRLPTASGWLLGMANVGGNSVPIFDLEALLQLPREASISQYLIIGEGEAAAGITLTGQPRRLRLPPEQRLLRNPPLPAALQPFVLACYRQERIWVEWDFRAFFTAVGAQL